MVELTLYHYCNSGTNTVPPLGHRKLTLGTKIFFPRFFFVRSTIAKVKLNFKDLGSLKLQKLVSAFGDKNGRGGGEGAVTTNKLVPRLCIVHVHIINPLTPPHL